MRINKPEATPPSESGPSAEREKPGHSPRKGSRDRQSRQVLVAGEWQDQKRSPVKAIRQKCSDCCTGSLAEIRRCTDETCPLWPFRMGRNIYHQSYAGPKEASLGLEQNTHSSKKENSQ